MRAFTALVLAAVAAAVSASTPPAPAEMLRPSAFWIRATAAPYYHAYLQPPAPGATGAATGAAILGDAATAGQFFLTYGRLVLVSAGKELDAVVSEEVIGAREDGTGGRLAVRFQVGSVGSGKGGFVYSGDAVGWRRGGVEREDGAWLVCGGELFVDLGREGEETPDGCVDLTIHFYFGATAEV
ncbi:hypothetical protein ACLOAV_006614 [Pseudogymnoascus australis]